MLHLQASEHHDLTCMAYAYLQVNPFSTWERMQLWCYRAHLLEHKGLLQRLGSQGVIAYPPGGERGTQHLPIVWPPAHMLYPCLNSSQQ